MTSLLQSLIVHAHCYQPPREDPWLEQVGIEPSAAPDHDWNARIDRECYARLGRAEARLRDSRATARDPDARERDESRDFLAQLQRNGMDDKDALTRLCHALLSTNEFVTLE